MSRIIDNTYELLNGISTDFDAEELQLAGLQGLIASEISMKRQDMGLNQKQFAALMGVSQGLISKWETGETNFTLQTLVRIASKLNIPMQSPYVPRPAKIYVPSGADIINISDARGWKTAKSSSCPYEAPELEELKEM